MTVFAYLSIYKCFIYFPEERPYAFPFISAFLFLLVISVRDPTACALLKLSYNPILLISNLRCLHYESSHRLLTLVSWRSTGSRYRGHLSHVQETKHLLIDVVLPRPLLPNFITFYQFMDRNDSYFIQFWLGQFNCVLFL